MSLFRDSPWVNLFRDSPFDLGLAAGVLPPVGCDPYGGVMSVGGFGGSVGFDSDLPNSYGAMNPTTINGATIFQIVMFGGDLGAGVMTMNGNAEIPSGGGRNLLITIGTDIEREWQWNPGNGDYTVNGALALENYLEGEVGNDLQVCINWGSGGE